MPIELLKKHGLKNTKARSAVIAVLDKAQRPLSHSELQDSKSLAGLDRVTLYRILDALSKAKLVHRVQDSQGVWRFCSQLPVSSPSKSGKAHCPGNHVHFFCLRCGQMQCMPEQPLPWVSAPKGGEVLSKQLLVHGYCAVCSARVAAPRKVSRSSKR